jgi:ribosome-binding protein aMBF1 (putative translation factor)
MRERAIAKGPGGVEIVRASLRKRRDPDEESLFSAIAAQVAQRRKDLALSQAELADLCGTTQSAIARIERGLRPPRIDTLLRIARALDCELTVTLRRRTREDSR